MSTHHDYRSPALITVSPLNPGELPADYRVRLAEERAAADERRRTELLDKCLDFEAQCEPRPNFYFRWHLPRFVATCQFVREIVA